LSHFSIAYNYEPHLFKLSNGTFYTPDFFLLQSLALYNIPAGWVELKGWRKEDGRVPSQEKIDLFVKEFGRPVFVLAEQDELWRKISDEVGFRIPLWERPRRNLRTHPQVFGLPVFPPMPSPETSDLR
jgi:hypothetical protein